jgi:hypothetical protein
LKSGDVLQMRCCCAMRPSTGFIAEPDRVVERDLAIILAGDHAEAIQTCSFGQVVLRLTVQPDARWKSAGMHAPDASPLLGCLACTSLLHSFLLEAVWGGTA